MTSVDSIESRVQGGMGHVRIEQPRSSMHNSLEVVADDDNSPGVQGTILRRLGPEDDLDWFDNLYGEFSIW
jgi:hypothetical protein